MLCERNMLIIQDSESMFLCVRIQLLYAIIKPLLKQGVIVL